MGHKDADWLREKYHTEGLTQKEIADCAGVCRQTIIKWMGVHNIETRDVGCAQAEGEYKDASWLRKKYVDEQLSQKEIAKKFDVGKTTVKYWLDKHGIDIRNKSEAAKVRAERYPHTTEAGAQALREHGSNPKEEMTDEEFEAFTDG